MTADEYLQILREDVLAATPLLLGWTLSRGDLKARIVEVEAYRSDEPAAHSYRKTKMKNMAMFGPPGHAYVYFSYGCHWMLNLVAHDEGSAAAILIRAAEPISGREIFKSRRPKAKRDEDLLSGPGKLAAAFHITDRDNSCNLLSPEDSETQLQLTTGEQPRNILRGPRVGIALGKAHDFQWRFVDGDQLRWVSRPHNFESL